MKKISVILLIVLIVFTGCTSGNEAFTNSIQAVDTVSLIKDTNIAEEIAAEEVAVEVVSITSENEVFLNAVVGDVLVERNGQVFQTNELDFILEGDIVLTGVDSSVVISISDMREVTLEENTILLFKENSVLSSTEKIVLVLKHGSIVSDVKDKLNGKSSFEILTPSMITSIRGTVVNVTHDKNTNTSKVSFYEGYGRVADIASKNITTIVSGQSLGVDKGVFNFELVSEEHIKANSPTYSNENVPIIEELLTEVSVKNKKLLSAVAMEEVDAFQIDFEDVDDDTKMFYDVKTISEDKVIDFDKNRKEIEKEIEKEEKELDKDEAALEREADKAVKEVEKEADKAVKDAEKEAEEEVKDAEKEVKDTEKDAEKEVKDTEKDAEEEVKDTEKEAEEEAKDAEKEAEEEVKDTEKEAEEEVKDTEKDAEEEVKDAEKDAKEEVKDAEKEAEEVKDPEKEADKEAEKATKEADKEAVKDEAIEVVSVVVKEDDEEENE